MFRLKSLLIGLSALAIAACSTTASLYPVDGPLFDNGQVSEISASVEGITGNSGKISLTMPDGEEMTGRWSVVAPQATTTSWGQLFTQHGAVTGNTISSTNLAGTNHGQAYLTGRNGTTLDLEFSVGSGTADGYGIGRDSNGNIYKLLF